MMRRIAVVAAAAGVSAAIGLGLYAVRGGDRFGLLEDGSESRRIEEAFVSDGRLSTPVPVATAATKEEQPYWAVPYGKEPWRQPPVAVSGDRMQMPAQIDVGYIVDRVRHAFEVPSPGEPPSARADTYSATVTPDGLVFSPHRPAEDVDAGKPVPDPDVQLRLRTASVQVGEKLGGAPGSARSVLGNTAQRELGDGMIEHIEAKGTGVELVWYLPTRIGTGDVTVTLEATGLAYAGATAAGHHYADEEGIERVRIGAAQLVDAEGIRTDVAAQVVKRGLAYRLPAALLDNATFPVALDPLVTPEFGLDTPVETTGRRYGQAVAAFSNMYLVVWQDSRNGDSDIYGTRVNSAGLPNEPFGIPIAVLTGTQTQPSVAAMPSGKFWVVWSDDRPGSNGYDIYGSRVAAGAVEDPSGVVVTSANYAQYAPSVACSSANCAVAWQTDLSGTGSNRNIEAAILATNGAVTATNLQVSAHPINEHAPKIATNGTRYQILWERGGDIIGRRINVDGTFPSPEFVVANQSGNESYPAIAGLSGGTAYLAVWNYSVPGGAVQGRTIGDDEVLGPIVSIGVGANPAVASKSGEYLVAWDQENTRIKSRRVSSSGGLLGAEITVSNGPGRLPAVAVSPNTAANPNSNYLIVWEDSRKTTNGEIYGARVTAAGALRDGNGLPIFTIQNEEGFPDVAWNGSNWLVVWQDSRNSRWGVYGVGVAPNGTVLQPSGIPISTAVNHQQHPSVAAVGSTFLVAFEDHGRTLHGIYAVRVSSAFAVLDTTAIPVASSVHYKSSVDVAGNGASWLLAWQDWRNSPATSIDIYGTQVTTAGAVVQPSGIAISTQSSTQYMPSIASWTNGGGYFITWCDANSYHIYGKRISSSGAVLDPYWIAIGTASGHQQFAIAASAADSYLVVWSDDRTAGLGLWGRTVSTTSGITLGAERLLDRGRRDYPALAWDGSTYLAVWQQIYYGYDIGARYISRTGLPLGTAFIVSSDAGDELYPAVASNGAGWSLVAYHSVDTTATGSTERVAARRITADVDGDGFSGLVDDCNDSDASVYPGAPETCDLVDSNCNGSLVDGFPDLDADQQPDCIDPDDDNDVVADVSDNCPLVPNPNQRDTNGNGIGDACENDPDHDGDATEHGDAAFDPNTLAGAVEICDGIDNDGDGLVDEGAGCEVCQ